MIRRRQDSLRPAAFAAVAGVVVALIALAPGAAEAQKLELRNQSKVVLGRSQITSSSTLSDKRYQFGVSNVFRQGRDLDNTFSGRLQATTSTKLQLSTRRAAGETGWEVKLNQKLSSFTFDIGAGSDGLFHSGVLFGERKGKGFGFSASWVGDERRSGANLQLWHTVETIDVTVALRRDRRGFGWSADTGKNLANILRGVLRYETSGGVNGNGSSQQVVYGRDMRTGADSTTDFDAARLEPAEDVFGDDGINIRSPMYPEDDPLAWIVDGYGARLGSVDLGTKRLIEAEVISYVSDSVWLGGEFTMEDGIAETIDTSVGISGEDLNLAASFGYSPNKERFSGTIQLRWIPFQRATPQP